MPRAVNGFSQSSLRPALYSRPAGVVAIRAELDSESRDGARCADRSRLVSWYAWR